LHYSPPTKIKEKLYSLGLSQELSKDILADIFGRQVGIRFEKRLADYFGQKSCSIKQYDSTV